MYSTARHFALTARQSRRVANSLVPRTAVGRSSMPVRRRRLRNTKAQHGPRLRCNGRITQKGRRGKYRTHSAPGIQSALSSPTPAQVDVGGEDKLRRNRMKDPGGGLRCG